MRRPAIAGRLGQLDGPGTGRRFGRDVERGISARLTFTAEVGSVAIGCLVMPPLATGLPVVAAAKIPVVMRVLFVAVVAFATRLVITTELAFMSAMSAMAELIRLGANIRLDARAGHLATGRREELRGGES